MGLSLTRKSDAKGFNCPVFRLGVDSHYVHVVIALYVKTGPNDDSCTPVNDGVALSRL